MKKVAFSLLLFLISNGFLWAQESKVVSATGYGAILANDLVKAKDDAVNDALRKAVEQVVGIMVDSKTITENFMLLEDKIYTKTSGYVQKYDIISSNKNIDGAYEVTIKAIVKTSDLENDLQGIITTLRREGMPRTMVIIKEKSLHNSGWRFTEELNTAETALMNTMIAHGFPFVDATQSRKNIRQTSLSAAINGDANAAAAIAKQYGAEVLILGTATSSTTQLPVMRSSGMKSHSANLNLRVVRADDAVIIATVTSRGIQAHIDAITGGSMAIEKAAKDAGKKLKDAIIKSYQQNQNAHRQIQLQVTGITSFNQLNTLKSALPYYVRGIKNLYQRSFGAGEALFDIEVTQKAESVAAELAAKEFEGIKLDIIGVTQNKLTAKIISQ